MAENSKAKREYPPQKVIFMTIYNVDQFNTCDRETGIIYRY